MNTIGIDDNLDRARIGKLLALGLLGCALTGAGDFLLGYAEPAEVTGGAFEAVLATAINLSDGTLFAGGLLGFFGLFVEGLAFFGIYRLMADAAPRYAHVFRSGILFYLWLAPVGCHMNMALISYLYKRLLLVDPLVAHEAMGPMLLAFCIPLYVLLMVGWIPLLWWCSGRRSQRERPPTPPTPSVGSWLSLPGQ